jgi:hypothetical protein
VFVDPPSTGRTLITAPLNFGATEGILHARALGSGSVEIGGGLSGSGGVTVAGYMSLRGSSSYTGTTTVDGKLKLLDDVIAGQPGPLGADSSPVVIDGSASSGAMTLYPAPSATIQFARDLTINTYNSTGAATLALGTLPGGAGRAVVSGNIQLNGALTLAGSGIPGADRFVISGDISGSGRLVSPSYVTLSGDNTFSGGVVMNFGSLTVGSDTALGTGTVWFNTVDIGFLSASTTVTLNNPIVITGVAHFSGANVMTLAGPIDLDGGQRSIYADNSATTTITGEVFDGSLTKMGAGLLQMTHVRLPTLAVNAGTLKILPNGTNAGTSRVQAFTISSTTSGIKLDLTDNDLIYDYNPGGIASATGFTRTYLHGGQLITSLGDGVHTGLGYGEASVLGLSSFDGQSIDSTTVLIKFTYFGDANLDGKVDIQDLLALARHYNTTGNQVWTNGDFNYDGVVNNTDLTLLVANWQAGVGAPLGEPLDATLANLTGSASVPEPALAALVATPLLLSARRRRKSRLFCP